MLDVTVKTLDSHNHPFTCEEDITVRGFKEFICDTVSVPADSQRLIYCGRVLQDEKKLNDYDVNGKVIHLVQRAPPQPESRSSTTENQRQSNNNANRASRLYRNLNTNTMYLGAMSVPTEVVEGLNPPQLSNTLSYSRLIVASSMLNKAIQLMDRMDDPSAPLHPTPSQRSDSAQVPQEEENSEPDSNMETNNSGVNDVQASSSNGTMPRTQGIDNFPDFDTSEEPVLEERPQDTSTSAETNAEAPRVRRAAIRRTPRPLQMAELLTKFLETQTRLQPFVERYRMLMSTDPVLTPGAGTDGVQENQKIVDGVSECLHYISHACHALSDIIVDMGQQPPRNLRCRPIIIQRSAILQAGIPIQVESHVNLHGRSSTSNNSDNENNETTRPSSPMTGGSDDSERSNASNQPNGQSNNTQRQAQHSLLGALLNLPSNVELSMEMSPPTTIEINPNAMDSSDNDRMSFNIFRDTALGFLGQNTQARSNIGTHPTTSTQTRSTARPHVLHSASHPISDLGQGLEFDPFLPCNSHHISRTSSQNSTSAQSTTTNQTHSETQTRPAGIGFAMALGELMRDAPGTSGSVRISILQNGSNIPRDRGTAPANNASSGWAQLLRTFLLRQVEGQNFGTDLGLFLLRHYPLERLIRYGVGHARALMIIRSSLREFVESNFPNETSETLPDAVVENIITFMRPYIRDISDHQDQISNPRVDVYKTVEYVIRNFCMNMVKTLINNDMDDAMFALEVLKLIRKLMHQFTALLHYLYTGTSSREQALVTIFNQLTRDYEPDLRRMVETLIMPQVRSLASRISPLSLSHTTELLVYKDTEPDSAGSSNNTTLVQESRNLEEAIVPEPMETDSDDAVEAAEDPLSIEGEDIPETFPGHENVPSDWVPIIAQDVVRQRRQIEIQNRNGGPVPFSDGYLAGMPSKRRKLVEQQKSPLLVSPSPNHTAIASSVEKLLKEGINQSGVQEVEGAASAVAADSNVRSTFGQAIRECLNPNRILNADFPNAKRFPNSSKRFSDPNQSSNNKKE